MDSPQEDLKKGDLTELFIEAVRDFPVLWDTSSPHYKDQRKKENAWKLLVDMECVRKLGLTSVDKTKAFWKNLRDRFVKEKNRVRIVESKSGSAATTARGSQWRFYPLLSFLGQSVSHRRTSSNCRYDKKPSDSSSQSQVVETRRKEDDACSGDLEAGDVEDMLMSHPAADLDITLDDSTASEEEEGPAQSQQRELRLRSTASRITASSSSSGTSVVGQPGEEVQAPQGQHKVLRPPARRNATALPPGREPAAASRNVTTQKRKHSSSAANSLERTGTDLLSIGQQLLTNSASRPATVAHDANSLFGQQVACTLAKLPERTAAVTRLRIQQLLVEAEFGSSSTTSQQPQFHTLNRPPTTDPATSSCLQSVYDHGRFF